MFARKTLLVVGAGASREAGLPIGEELAAKICSLMFFEFEFGRLKKGSEEMLQNLRLVCGDNPNLNEHLKAARQITEGVRLVSSIDNYIDTHRNDPRIALCGKTAILHAIADAEASSLLKVDKSRHPSRMNFDQLEKTWYRDFGKLLVDSVRVSDIDSIFDNLTIICFNYDRCLEQFITYWLASVYAIEPETVAGLLAEKFHIIRPYGSIGTMRDVAFGTRAARIDLRPLVKNIKTYTEQIEDADILSDIRGGMEAADTIVFLGFAFHSQNLELLSAEGAVNPKRIFATAYGFSAADTGDIRASLHRLLVPNANPHVEVRNDLTCVGLFNEFRRTLSA